MLCYLQQITLRLAAKRKAKCSKTQGKMQQNAGEMLLNAPKNATKRKAECINLHVLSCC